MPSSMDATAYPSTYGSMVLATGTAPWPYPSVLTTPIMAVDGGRLSLMAFMLAVTASRFMAAYTLLYGFIFNAYCYSCATDFMAAPIQSARSEARRLCCPIFPAA